MVFVEGLELIARYAFAPNSKKYCGPENASQKILQFITKEKTVGEKFLKNAFSKFEVMFPYLQLIAEANNKSPFDLKTAEAYWQGSELLENVKLEDWKKAAKLVGKSWEKKIREKYVERINAGFLPHHSFHVLNSFSLTVKEPEIMLDRINNCIISWGKVVQVENDVKELNVEKKNLVLGNEGNGFEFEDLIVEKVKNLWIVNCNVGDWVSMHWGFACKKLGGKELENLQKYTMHNLKNFIV